MKLNRLLAGTLALVLIAGLGTPAFAGFVCEINPATLDLGTFATDVVDVEVALKEISCGENITIVNIDTSDCETKGVFVSFVNQAINPGVWTADEIINGITAPHGIEVHCDVIFDISNGADSVSQTIWLIPDDPFIVGGELIPIESTSLILAGSQTFSWMIPVVLSGIGIGLFVVSRKSD